MRRAVAHIKYVKRPARIDGFAQHGHGLASDHKGICQRQQSSIRVVIPTAPTVAKIRGGQLRLQGISGCTGRACTVGQQHRAARSSSKIRSQ